MMSDTAFCLFRPDTRARRRVAAVARARAVVYRIIVYLPVAFSFPLPPGGFVVAGVFGAARGVPAGPPFVVADAASAPPLLASPASRRRSARSIFSRISSLVRGRSSSSSSESSSALGAVVLGGSMRSTDAVAVDDVGPAWRRAANASSPARARGP